MENQNENQTEIEKNEIKETGIEENAKVDEGQTTETEIQKTVPEEKPKAKRRSRKAKEKSEEVDEGTDSSGTAAEEVDPVGEVRCVVVDESDLTSEEPLSIEELVEQTIKMDEEEAEKQSKPKKKTTSESILDIVKNRRKRWRGR